jgi:murein DD-endopeptidase MepM/ murein hydrolase activator NlpD
MIFFITQKFGNDFIDLRTGKYYYKSNYGLYGHNGIDLIPHAFQEIDVTVYSIFSGVVMFADWDTSYGNRVKIWNKELGICDYYCHLATIDNKIKEGLEIKEKTILGIMGNTGISMGKHLHYQICRVDEKCNKLNTDRNDKDCMKGYINPSPFLKEG